MSKKANKKKKVKTLTITENDYLKASRCGEFQANKDNGFKGTHKAHKSMKDYSRKQKHTLKY